MGAGAGGARGGMPGDWTCPTCADLVFAKHFQCRKCGTHKDGSGGRASAGMGGGAGGGGGGQPLSFSSGAVSFQSGVARGMRIGDWNCPNCGDHQFAKNESCRRCQTQRPANGEGVCGLKDGDWFCPSCKDLQYSRNDVCRLCATPRPGGGRARERSRSPYRA